MVGEKVELRFEPLVNQPSLGRLKLKLDLAKYSTVRKLKEKVARKINYFPECIALLCRMEVMEDEKELKSFNLKNGDQLVIILSRRDEEEPKNVEPLIVGGLDLTDIKQFRGLLKKKNLDFLKEALPVGNEVPAMVPPGPKKEIDLHVLYKTQLQQLKAMGLEDQAKNIAVLLSVNGNFERALDQLLKQ